MWNDSIRDGLSELTTVVYQSVGIKLEVDNEDAFQTIFTMELAPVFFIRLSVQ